MTAAKKKPSGPRVIAIANQKGGVGKSTTSVSLGAAIAEAGHTVLVVDLYPQGNASTGLGIKPDDRGTTIYDMLVSEAPIDTAITPTAVTGLSAVSSTIDLAGGELSWSASSPGSCGSQKAPAAGDGRALRVRLPRLSTISRLADRQCVGGGSRAHHGLMRVLRLGGSRSIAEECRSGSAEHQS